MIIREITEALKRIRQLAQSPRGYRAAITHQVIVPIEVRILKT